MLNSIRELFDHLDEFAELIAKTDLLTTVFEHHDSPDEHVEAVWTTFAPRSQFSTMKEAFAAIFCEELYEMYDWDKTAHSPGDLSWIPYLKEGFIPEHFLKYQGGLKLENVDTIDFIRKMKFDLVRAGVEDAESAAIIEKITYNPEVIRLKKGHTIEKYFGQNEDYYFVYESGIYV